jgi:flavin-binding protein dodecin
MADPVYRKCQIVGTSAKSFDDAAANAVANAGKDLRNVSWFEVLEQRGSVADGKIQQFQVTIQVGYRVD